MSAVDTTHRDYDKMVDKWQRCRDAVSGRDAVHAAGEKYLPKLKDQSSDSYNAYKTRAQFFNATWRTISALAGMIFRKAPVVEVDASIQPFTEDITLSGISLHILAQRSTIEVLSTGRMGLLVDYPPNAIEDMTVADAESFGLRPAIQFYPAESIKNWKTTRINNKTVLSLVVLSETYSEDENEFKEKTETHYRVLDLVQLSVNAGGGFAYRVREFRLNDKKEDEQIGKDIFPLMNGKHLGVIPFYFIGIDDTTPEVDEPPLIDLVDLNLDHYRLDADYKNGLHFTGLPTPVVSGYTPANPNEKLFIGSEHAWVFTDPSATASFLEYSGSGLSSIKEAKDTCEQQMAIVGARLLISEKKDAETEQTALIHRAPESSILSAIAQTISIGFTNALKMFSMWAGGSDKVSFKLNDDFVPVGLSAGDLSAILQSWQAGMPGFSDESVFAMLKKKDVVAQNVTLEDEQERIANKAIPKPDMTV